MLLIKDSTLLMSGTVCLEDSTTNKRCVALAGSIINSHLSFFVQSAFTGSFVESNEKLFYSVFHFSTLLTRQMH